MIYLDNAATTMLDEEAMYIMREYNYYDGNPSSLHKKGTMMKKEIISARKVIAEIINAEPEEIYFTSGGTESDNWAMNIGACLMDSIYVSPIEHHAILHTPYDKKLLEVDNFGRIKMESIEKRYIKNSLVSVMMANNEIGTIQDIEEISKLVHSMGGYVHSDMVQAFCHMPVDVKKLGVDYASFSGHKFGAPTGVGFMYIKDGVPKKPFIYGGGQEMGMRSGTENVGSIVAMSVVANKKNIHLYENSVYVANLREWFEKKISDIDCVQINSSPIGHPGISSITFKGHSGIALLIQLSMHDICVSAGSACSSNSDETSHVLKSIGLSDEYAESTLRFSFDENNNFAEVNRVSELLHEILE